MKFTAIATALALLGSTASASVTLGSLVPHGPTDRKLAEMAHLRHLHSDSMKDPRRLSCGRDSPDIEGECKTTRQCKNMYPDKDAFDCKRSDFGDSDVGECFCGERGRDEVLCGCIDTCGRDSPDIEGECETTRQCKEKYPDKDAFDCKRSDFGDPDVGECYCGERGRDEALCGCIDDVFPEPPTRPECVDFAYPKEDLLNLNTEWWNWAWCTDLTTPTYSLRDCAPQDLVREGWYFLAGSGQDEEGQIIERECGGIPNNVFILIPVVNLICTPDDNCEDLYTFAAFEFELDGGDVKVQTFSPGEEKIFEPSCHLPEDFEGYQDTRSYFAGLWLVIPPLSVGKHVLKVKGGIPEFPFTTEVEHTLTVVSV